MGQRLATPTWRSLCAFKLNWHPLERMLDRSFDSKNACILSIK